MEAVFAGPDDSETCDGCSEAVAQGVVDIDEVAEPGEFECQARCRHFVQLVSDNEGQDGQTFDWNGSAGFTENPVQGEYDYTAQANSEVVDYTDTISSTPGYDSSIDTSNLGADPEVQLEDTLAQPADDLFGSIGELLGDDQLDALPAEILAQVLFDYGLAPEDLAIELGLTDAETASLTVEYNDLMGANLNTDKAIELLSTGRVEELQSLAQAPEFLDVLQKLADAGFDDSEAEYAYTISEVIGGTPYLADDGRWYLKLQESMREGSSLSGNHGHVGNPGHVGGSGPAGTDRPNDLVYSFYDPKDTAVEAVVTSNLPPKTETFTGDMYHAMESGTHAENVQFHGEPFIQSGGGVYGPGLYLAGNKDDAGQYGEVEFTTHVENAKFAVYTHDQYNAFVKFLSPVADGGYYNAKDVIVDALNSRGYDGIKITDPYGSKKITQTKDVYVTDWNIGSTITKVSVTEADAKPKSIYILFAQSKQMKEGSELSGNYGHVGQGNGEVGGSGPAKRTQPGTHVLKVSEEAGSHEIKTTTSQADDAVLVYNGFPTDTRIKNTILKQIDKNIDQVLSAQGINSIGEVFLTDSMYHFSMAQGKTSLASAVGITLTDRQPPIIGFNSSNIAMKTFDKSNFSVSDSAKSTSNYARLIVDHEMGHVLYNTLGYNKRQEFNDAFKSSTRAKFTEYGDRQVGEAFAEAYSAYVNNKSMPKEYETYMASITDNHKLTEAEQQARTDLPIAYVCGFQHGPTYHIYKDRIETL